MAEGGNNEFIQEGSREKQCVPAIRKVLKSIADEITDEELHTLLFLAKDHIPKGQIQNMNCLKLIAALEERQIIDTKCNKMDYLVELLQGILRVDLIEKLSSTTWCSHQVQADGYQRTTITENIVEVDGPSLSHKVTALVSELYQQSGSNHKQPVVDGGFLQDPDLVNSTFNDYDQIIGQLEKVTREKETALLSLQLSEASKAVLQSKVNSLEMEVVNAKDDQNNFICERNNALAAKSELAFKETETTKELSEVKVTKLLLEKNLIKCNAESEKQEKEMLELKGKLEESENTVKKQDEEIVELKCKMEKIRLQKNFIEDQLKEMHSNMEGENGRIKCKRCGLIFIESNNPVDACRYHAGKYDTMRSLRKKLEWSCCKNTNKNAPGCQKKKHLSIDYPLSPGLEIRTDRLGTM